MTVISFENVTKTFHRRVGQRLLRHYISDMLGREDEDSFHALDKLSFSIADGESVAIVGSNGAGKSTLLSLVTGLVPPTSGQITVNGRVAALLELGAGFHPDLTGRENVRLNASVMGFSRRQAEERYQAIVEFAEMHEFIDEPLRTYSKGMVLRLGFAVAVEMDPQVLIVDEVLAVGDQKFQTKCIEKIYEIRDQGRTILCASHSGSVLRGLCTRALWLDHGQLVMDGPVAEVVAAYEGKTVPARGPQPLE